MKPGTRFDRKTNQYVPTIDGIDISPTSYDECRALEIAIQSEVFVRCTPLIDKVAKLKLVNAMLLDALRDVSKAYQDMFDVMPVAWQTIDHIVNAAIAKVEGVTE